MPRRVAFYPGSFDPLTLGHLDLITRGASLFDEIVVGVGHNPAKSTYWFDLQQRLALAAKACSELSNVRIAPFTGLLVHAVQAEGATVVLRGLRSAADFDSEFRYGLANRDLTGIETMFLLAAPELSFVSSSIVKEIDGNGGDVSRYVPPVVLAALRSRRVGA
ncbi:MAG: pantetheine-phosphate adenylyltransferase [Myxococcota bacterium]|jgi:pantetheine-phosphate adenylyltransferase